VDSVHVLATVQQFAALTASYCTQGLTSTTRDRIQTRLAACACSLIHPNLQKRMTALHAGGLNAGPSTSCEGKAWY